MWLVVVWVGFGKGWLGVFDVFVWFGVVGLVGLVWVVGVCLFGYSWGAAAPNHRVLCNQKHQNHTPPPHRILSKYIKI